MYDEKSCGAVTFTIKNSVPYYVLVQNQDGIYGFPKGHMEKGENEMQTAYREIYEEVHLKPIIIDGFRETNTYNLIVNNKEVTKLVVYFLAYYENQEIFKQDLEINTALLVSYERAMELIQIERTKEILTAAHDFLNKNNYINKNVS